MKQFSILFALLIGSCQPCFSVISECTVRFGSLIYKDVSYVVYGKNRVISVIGFNKQLKKEAKVTGLDHRIQKDLDRLIQLEIAGAVDRDHRDPLGNGYFELKSQSGARLFIKRKKNDMGGEDIIIVGKASKTVNQGRVFDLMYKDYPDFPEPPQSMKRQY